MNSRMGPEDDELDENPPDFVTNEEVDRAGNGDQEDIDAYLRQTMEKDE